VYRRLEGDALEEMAEHFHAHNDFPKGTVHLAAQRLADSAVWEKRLTPTTVVRPPRRSSGPLR
jgi:hypothetical protein